MSQKVRNEALPRLRQRYVNRSKVGKKLLLDEVCEQWGYSRKHAIKLLNAKSGWGGNEEVRKGRPPIYTEAEVRVLERIWKSAEQPCGKRLKALLPLWLGPYEAEYGPLESAMREKLLKISAAQIDRLLAPKKIGCGKGLCGTKPGTLLKTQIPIRTDNWDINKPGYLEADTVAHCGESLSGDFIWSITYTDIYSGWTETRAVWNKGAAGIVDMTRRVEKELPFEVLGFDCDNGSEFLNYHLIRYFCERPKKVKFTRSRPYHKNDNGHVEEKNWTHVRQLLGYDRLDDPALVEAINRLYRQYWNKLHNYYLPEMKLVKKDREGSKVHRRHDAPKTPCQRLLDCPDISDEVKTKLRKDLAALNPFKLQRQVETQLKRILLRARSSTRPTGSLRCEHEEAILQTIQD